MAVPGREPGDPSPIPRTVLLEDTDDDEEEPGSSAERALFDLPVMRRALALNRSLRSVARRSAADAPPKDDPTDPIEEDQTSPSISFVNADQLEPHLGPAVRTLKPYQLAGISFLAMLLRSDIPGCLLSDDMGLGKTAQTICYLGAARHIPHLRNHIAGGGEHPGSGACRNQSDNHNRGQVKSSSRCSKTDRHAVSAGGPDVIVCPVSLLDNWARELARWDESCEVRVLYGATKKEAMADLEEYVAWMEAKAQGETEEDEESPFDTMLVPYSIFERATSKAERVALSKIPWAHCVLDEAHSAKNRSSTRFRKLEVLCRRASRTMLITGTPLQNSLDELHALLQLTLPDVAQAAADLLEHGTEEQCVSALRKVLTSVMLRRLKAEVADQLPPKIHHVELVGMSVEQSELYRKATDVIRSRLTGKSDLTPNPPPPLLAAGKADNHHHPCTDLTTTTTSPTNTNATTSVREAEVEEDADIVLVGGGGSSKTPPPPPPPQPTTTTKNPNTTSTATKRRFDGLDLDLTLTDADFASQKKADSRSLVAERMKALGAKDVANMFVRLRKIAYHPLLVRSRYDDVTCDAIADLACGLGAFGPEATCEMGRAHVRTLSDWEIHGLCQSYSQLQKRSLPPSAVLTSGKMQALVALCTQLRDKGSRPLIFSQWTSVLDLVGVAFDQAGFRYVRLDGSTAGPERQELCDSFNAPDSPIFAFLLTTRAGGVGLNLTGADTVVLHDVDFNPQMDLQAEDRAHRLGQEKPVRVYRLVTEGSVDERILACANRKLKLGDELLGGGGVQEEGAKGGGEGKEEDGLAVRMMGEILADIATSAY